MRDVVCGVVECGSASGHENADGRGCHGDGVYLCTNPGKQVKHLHHPAAAHCSTSTASSFWLLLHSPFGHIPSLTHSPFLLFAMEVANLEAAFERVTVTDENEEQISSSTTSYHKTKV